MESEDDDSSSSDFDIDQYSCKEEKKFFKEYPYRKRINLSEEVIGKVQKQIAESCIFKEYVYDQLQVIEVFGEPWFHKTRVDYIIKILRDPEDFVEIHPLWISDNLNDYCKIYIRVSGIGSRYCHHGPRGIEHMNHGIYFVVEREGMYGATLTQHCFSNEYLYDRKQCKAIKPQKHTQWGWFQPVGIEKYSPERHELFISLFGNIDDGSDRLKSNATTKNTDATTKNTDEN